ncbi:MAG: hypothetical protein PUC65_11750 [Clostridiales bacterium]|nr:hypothetical protein [Clostridiales bacterium]
MTTEKVNDLELVRLSDYFVPEKFRTVPGESSALLGGVTEIQVEFNIREKFAKRLHFDFSSLLIIYGYGQMNDKLCEINEHKYVRYLGEGVLKRISLNDCGERFVMVFELSDAPDILKAVTADEVEKLLNNCRHPNNEIQYRG